jgi:hypothetical protein
VRTALPADNFYHSFSSQTKALALNVIASRRRVRSRKRLACNSFCHYPSSFRHYRARRENPFSTKLCWIPAYAGMTKKSYTSKLFRVFTLCFILINFWSFLNHFKITQIYSQTAVRFLGNDKKKRNSSKTQAHAIQKYLPKPT